MIAKKIPMRKASLSSFEGLVNYLTTSQGVHNRVGKVDIHNCQSDDLQWAIQETLLTQDQNKRSNADKTYHLMVSFAASEYLDNEQLAKIEATMVEALGYANHQRVSVVHHDTDNLHFHVAINKVHPDKFTVHEPYHDFKILGQICRQFEDEYGLQKVARGGGKNKSIDMEEVAGIESLIGWVRRECANQIKAAKTWGQLHQVLTAHGLEIKPRGNGFIISNGEINIKASSVERNLSKAQLEARLGSFEALGERSAGKAAHTYQERPLSQVNVDGLYQQYVAENELQRQLRQQEFVRIAELRDTKIEAIKLKYAFRRSLVKHSGSGITKRLLYKMLYRQMRREMDVVRLNHRQQRDTVFKQGKKRAWADWLKHQAKNGNEDALRALRSRGKSAKYGGNCFVGDTQNDYAELNVDTVTKKGTVIYAEDALTIRDTGSALKLAAIPDDKAVLRALEIAISRYGNELNIKGTQHFKDKVARVAAAAGMVVKFSDGTLNQRYQHYAQEFEYVRQGKHQYRSTVGAGRANTAERGRTNRGAVGITRPGRYRWHGFDRRRNGGINEGVSNAQFAHIGSLGAGRSAVAASRGDGLRGMPQRGVVRGQGGAEVLLPRHVSGDVEQPRATNHPVVRRTIYRPRGVVTAAQIRAMQAVVGNVARPGTRPPEGRRGRLDALSVLSIMPIAQNKPRGRITDTAAKAEVELKGLIPIEKYLHERQEKIQKGFDIMNHRPYNPTDAGTFSFGGLRFVDGQALVLLKDKEADEILVKEITPYAAGRLAKVKLDSAVKVTATGQIKVVKSRTI